MTVAAIRERDVTAGGVRIRLSEAGAGRPVVLVHGNFASRRWWYEQLGSPPPGLRLLAPDLPNFGASQPLPGAIGMDAYAAALASLLDTLKLERPLLVGHSMGAAVVERLVLARPGATTGLLLVNGPPPAGLPRSEEHYALLAGLVGRREALRAALDPMCATRKPAFWDQLIDDALAMREDAYDGNARTLGREVLPAAPASPAIPVAVLHGALDPLITPEMALATSRHWPGSRRTTWNEVGHSPQLEAPARFGERLAAFAEEAAMT